MPDPKVTELARAAVNNTIKEIDVAEWGGTQGVNCYAFAVGCKKPGKGKPDPGDKSKVSGKQDGRFDPALLKKAAVADGLTLLGGSQTDPPSPRNGYYLVALYISSGNPPDHHWYRKDPDFGRWVHKPGAAGIRNFGVGFKVLPTELVLISHDYGSAATNYKFVAFFEVPDGGLDVG